MIDRNARRSASSARDYRVVSRDLTNCLVLFTFFILLAGGPADRVFGRALGLNQQSPTTPPGANAGTADESDLRELEPGKPVKRELAGGQRHRYRVKLGADQFLKVVVEQDGVDVVVQLAGPDERQLIELDSEIRLRGSEILSQVAETAGDYRVIVQPKQKTAAAGNYQIRIEELRAATEPDHALQEAQRLYQEYLKLQRMGRFDEAIPLVERVLEIRKKILGPEHREVALAYSRLAVLYSIKGDFAKAEPLFQQARVIAEKALGPDHPEVAAALANLGILYVERGDYAKAEPLYQRALNIRERALGPDHRDVAATINSLASLYRNQGRYHKAEPLYQRALILREKMLGPDHVDVASTLSNLGLVYQESGNSVKARPLFERALTIREKVLGPENPYVADSLDNLANVYLSQGDFAKAEESFKRALAIRGRVLGPDHPDAVASLNDLALLYALKGDLPQAVKQLARADAVGERNLELNLASGSERQKLAYLALFSKQTDFTLSLHSRAAPNDPQALDLAFTTLLRRKGRGLDAMADTVAALRRHVTPQNQELFDRLMAARSQLSALTLKESGSAKPDLYQTRIKPLEEKVEELEAELSSRSDAFRAQAKPVTLAAIQAALPPGGALVEFAVYTPWELRTRKNLPPRYLAYLLTAQGPPRWADLGEAALVDRAVNAWRQALRDAARADVKRLARTVDEKVARPVRALLGGMAGETRHLLIAPDGALNLIPFAALVDERNQYLVERYTISYLTSGSDLLRLQTGESSRNAPLVVASPIFGRMARVDRSSGNQNGRQGRSQVNLSEVFFQPLPGTGQEAEAIKTIFPEASVLLREAATETALKQAAAPSVLHIATHGFFLSDQPSAPTETRSRSGENPLRSHDQRLSRWAAKIGNPLLRSGLVLAGVNEGRSGDDDGVLTAMEAASLNLWGTRLVVLSACDTGVGEVRNGEGVYGLRRALVLAGSETQVMSLWPVSDKETHTLMVGYYKRLLEGVGRGEALRQIQLEMLKDPTLRHPYYWANFIQAGEWANLDGRR
ncbi:MAG TPA: tetratricopeptide repeat protein [Blastocatellia bacterium]|nr:tetratricopeptide repeat protein [Blastocatellia bacterium]